jgi:hypothetical protein
MSELDREMLRHLRAYRGETRPTPAQRDGALEGLLQRVRTGDAVAIDDEPAVPRSAAAPIRWAVAAASIAAIVAGASLVASERVRESPQPASSAAPYGDAAPTPAHEVVELAPPPPKRSVEPASPPTPSVVHPFVASAPVEREIPVAPRRAKPRPPPVVTPAPEPSVEPSIDAAEVAALRRAQAELSRAPADALAHLVEHASTYPSSSFAAERDVARATALCKLGRVDDARALAVEFEARRPDSPLLPRMRRICKSSRAIADGSAGSSH